MHARLRHERCRGLPGLFRFSRRVLRPTIRRGLQPRWRDQLAGFLRLPGRVLYRVLALQRQIRKTLFSTEARRHDNGWPAAADIIGIPVALTRRGFHMTTSSGVVAV